MTDAVLTSRPGLGMTQNERFVVFASSTGTIFEWYDFYLYATLAPFFAALFFPPGNDTAALLSAFATYAAGFLVRPFGALFFGRIGDLVGRKYTFLVTIMVMGISTFAVGLLPTYAAVGWLAPLLLVILRLLQGLALGGEYGGAATYVAEHAHAQNRGYATSWIQTTATLGFFLSLIVILICRNSMDPATFSSWGWRLPFLVSAFLLIFSVYIRLKLNESPVFAKMKAENKGSDHPLTDSFLRYPNNKYVLLALLGATMGQGVVWYTGQFYALFFLSGPLKLDYTSAYLLIAVSLVIGTPLFVLFGWLSDRIGRLKIILAGCVIAALTYFPLFQGLTHYVNPDLEAYTEKTKLAVTVDPAQCHFNVFVGPWSSFGDCDRAKDFMTKAGLSFDSINAPDAKATLDINGTKVEGFSAFAWSKALIDSGYPHLKAATSTIEVDKATADQLTALQADKKTADIAKLLTTARMAKDPAAKKIADTYNVDSVVPSADGSTATVTVSEIAAGSADKAKVNWFMAEVILVIMIIYVTMVYGPIAAFLVELFPTRIRYTSMSLPYHIGNGWFGGMLPLLATAMVAFTGNIYYGLWYPIVVAIICAIVGAIFLRDKRVVHLEHV
ncbi:MFS transporter [soil metagenome]